MSNIRSRLDKIKDIVESDSLYKQQSLGGELNFHIFDYDPADEMIVRNYVKDFIKTIRIQTLKSNQLYLICLK